MIRFGPLMIFPDAWGADPPDPADFTCEDCGCELQRDEEEVFCPHCESQP